MDISLKKESMNLSQMRQNDQTQILVEGDVIVPDVKPDIMNILQTDANAVVTNYEKKDGRLFLMGTIFLKILYVPEGAEDSASTIKSILTKFDFTDEMAVNEQEDNFIDVQAVADQVEYNLIHSRKMNFKIIVSLSLKTHSRRTVDFVTDVSGETPVEVRRQKVNLFNMKAVERSEFVIEENLDVPNGKPDIGEVLNVDVKIHKNDCKIMNNKAMIKGDLTLCSLYVGDMEGQGLEFMEHEVPFSEVIDIDGLMEGDLCGVTYEIKDIYFTVKEDLNGDPRLLGVEILVNCIVNVSETNSVDMVSDCYAPEGKTTLGTQKMQLEELVCDDTNQMTLKQLIDIPQEQPSVDGVYNVIARPVVTGKKIAGENLMLDGTVAVYILYVSSDPRHPLCSYREDVPFQHTIHLDGIDEQMASDVAVSMEHTSFSLNMASEVEVRCILEFNTKIIRSYGMDIITTCEVEEAEEEREMPSLVIYFAQPDDCMWDIAKRYKTTIDRIMNANKFDEDFMLASGQKILIPRR